MSSDALAEISEKLEKGFGDDCVECWPSRIRNSVKAGPWGDKNGPLPASLAGMPDNRILRVSGISKASCKMNGHDKAKGHDARLKPPN